jgi:hypothetical protein
MRRAIAPVAPIILVVAMLGGCALAAGPTNGPFAVTIAPGVQPRLRAADAVAITRQYLAQQQPELAAPDLHIDANVTEVWALPAAQASALDGCIPSQSSGSTVWVTRGVGDYLNLRDYPWSTTPKQTDDRTGIACHGPGPAGILVIDDATGTILGVYPLVPGYPHPSPG